MKNYKLILLIFTLIFTGCSTYKVFKPQNTNFTARQGFLSGETVYYSFFDSREDKSYSNELKSKIFKHLQNSYPSANIKKKPNYFEDPTNGNITIKVNLFGYSAGFGSKVTNGIGTINGKTYTFSSIEGGRWNGVTGFLVNLYDYRNSSMKKSSVIKDVETYPNTFGYATAKKALNESFEKTLNQLSRFIDQSLME